jgi:hypothetical protein
MRHPFVPNGDGSSLFGGLILESFSILVQENDGLLVAA